MIQRFLYCFMYFNCSNKIMIFFNFFYLLSIIIEGFSQYEQLHGIRYNKYIADGDSNVYKQILYSRSHKYLTIQNDD